MTKQELQDQLSKGFTTQNGRLKYQRLVEEAGQKKTIAVYGSTYTECLQKFDERKKAWIDSIKLCKALNSGHVKLYDGMKEYFTSHSKINGKKKAIKRSTNSRDLSTVENQIGKYKIGQKFADTITAEDLQKHIEKLIEDGYAESTVKKAKDCLRAYFLYLYKTPANPAYEIVIPHYEDITKSVSEIVEWDDILDDIEIIKFLKECDKAYIPNHRGTQYADLLKFLFYTYMRVGEACALRVCDYKKANGIGYISVVRNLARAGNEFYIDTPKQQKSIRTIKLNKEAQAIIENRIKDKKSTDLIWSQKNGDFVKYTSLEPRLKAIIKSIGCEKKLSIHSLRHSGVSFSLRHGAEISAVSRNAGHASVVITQNIYQHVLQDEKDHAIDVAELALQELQRKIA